MKFLYHLRQIFSCPFAYEDEKGFHLGEPKLGPVKTHKLKTGFWLIGLWAFLSFGLVTVSAENLYVTPTGAGATDGTSWTNAFNGMSDVSWGGSAGQVGPGDTLFVGAGSYSGFTAGASGSAGNYITIRAAQETQTGVATFTGNVMCNSRDYISIDGLYNGGTNFNITGVVNFNDSDYPRVQYCEIHGGDTGIEMSGTATHGGSVTNSAIYDINTFACINLTGREFNQTGAYSVFVVSNYISPNYFAGTTNADGGVTGDGSGPDGMQCCSQLLTMGNTFAPKVGTVNPQTPGDFDTYQHMDLMQGMESYQRISRNRFEGSADSAIDFDAYNGNPSNITIDNNEFILRRGSGIRFYSADAGSPLASLININIVGNTFVDHLSDHQHCFSVANLQGTDLNVSGFNFKGNIFYNCRDVVYTVAATTATQSSYGFDYNLINAGPHGETGVTLDGSSYTQSNPRTGAPSFIGYTEGSPGSNLMLASGDTAAYGQGIDLSSYGVTTFKDGTTRDSTIGANGKGSSGGSPATGNTVTIGTMTIGQR